LGVRPLCSLAYAPECMRPLSLCLSVCLSVCVCNETFPIVVQSTCASWCCGCARTVDSDELQHSFIRASSSSSAADTAASTRPSVGQSAGDSATVDCSASLPHLALLTILVYYWRQSLSLFTVYDLTSLSLSLKTAAWSWKLRGLRYLRYCIIKPQHAARTDKKRPVFWLRQECAIIKTRKVEHQQQVTDKTVIYR